MSLAAMTMVWKHYPRGGSEKLALLALADWCDDAGGSLYPSMATVAKKISSSESQARRIIRMLERAGLLECIKNPRGGAKGCTRHYQLRLDRLATGSTDATPTTTPGVGARDGLHGCAKTGSTHARGPLAPVLPNPSVHPLEEPSVEPPTLAVASVQEEVFTLGKRLLTSSGKTEASAGALLGKLRKEHGDSAILEALKAADVGRVSDPASFLIAACRGSAKAKRGIAIGVQDYSAGWGRAA